MSGGLQTDTESARLSNVQTFKYNAPARNPHASSIVKVAPTTIYDNKVPLQNDYRFNESMLLPDINRSVIAGQQRNPNFSTIINSAG